ncbi:hypothetical protein [Fictibacillus sp. UD]|uniref:hypothetical protein n=1 Tax=Fictibacillus sp. UD TaxID=3038777 RepID=UPI0037494503
MRDSCGTSGQVRHLRVKRLNVAHRLLRGKRAAWSGNRPHSKTTTYPFRKKRQKNRQEN